MNLQRISEILKMTENPKWALRTPDLQEVRTPDSAAGAPQGQPQKPQQPGKVPPQAIQKYADSLLGMQDNTAANPNAQPGIEGTPQTSLSDNIRMRMTSRREIPFAKQGIISYSGGM